MLYDLGFRDRGLGLGVRGHLGFLPKPPRIEVQWPAGFEGALAAVWQEQVPWPLKPKTLNPKP